MIEPPLPFGNAAARWYHVLLRGLVERGHRVTALASCFNENEIAEAMRLFPPPGFDLRCYLARAHGTFIEKLGSFCRPMSYLFSAELQRDLQRECSAGYDVLHLEQLWCAWLGPKDSSRTVANVHYLFDIDWQEQKVESMKDRLLRRRILRAERALLARQSNVCALSQRLSDRIGQIRPGARPFTIPLGLDLSLYPFEQTSPPRPPTLGLIGSFNWGPSLEAAKRLLRDLWPAIRARLPSAQLIFAGRDAKERLGELSHENVEVFSDPPDAKPYFRKLDLMLYAPPIGSGMKVKILEAFALGTAIVTNSQGVEGLPALDGVHAGIADDDAGLIHRAVVLLSDPALRQQHRLAARQLVESHCSPQATVDAVERMYADIIAAPSLPMPSKPGAS
jgi:glycosyltransferase involved in cell wall biosynthesis